MSRVISQAVPPSLLAEYQRLFRTTDSTDPRGRLIKLNTGVRAAQAESDQDPNTFAASDAAQWLTDQWVPTAIPSVRAEFFAARKAEILAGSYPGTYWWTPAPASDVTEYCLPTFLEIITPENSTLNPLYWDETRQPQRCIYHDVDHRYTTPDPPGTEQNPAPSWKGSVGNGIWQDAYHAQRLRNYNLPIELTYLSDRPLLLDLNATIQASASTRGHRNWFSLCIEIYNRPPGTSSEAVFLNADKDRYLSSIPPADPNGWSHTVTRRLLRRARDYWRRKGYGENKISVSVATTPGRGYYFARNDLVTVFHQIGLTVALAKKP